MALRYLSKFTSQDGSVEVVFPTARYEYEAEQELHTSFADLTGNDYDYDMIGDGSPAKKNGIERLRFFVVGDQADVDETADDIINTCYSIGRGYLYQSSASGLRRALGRLDGMPSTRVTVENLNHLPVFLTFQRMTDWQAVAS